MTIAEPNPIVENSNGRIEIVPGDDVSALSWSTWTFRWTPGFDVEPGGGMEIVFIPRFPTNRWSLPQIMDPTAPGYVTASAAGDVITSLDILRWPLLQKPHGATVHIIQVSVGGSVVAKGEVIEVTYGDKRGGSLGAQVQASARVVAIPVFVCSGQAPRFFERFTAWNQATDVATLRERSDFNPSLRVVGNRVASLHVVAPMEVEPGEGFDIRLSALDASCNAASEYEGLVELMSTTGRGLSSVRMEGAKATAAGVVLESPGFHRIYAIDADREILGVSNPIRVCAGARPVYWGEIHGHSELSDGNGTPDEHYTYARDVALLDFAAVTDHDESLKAHPERWWLAQTKAREYSRDGAFVALLGYEIGTRLADESRHQGDINAYYLDPKGEMLGDLDLPLKVDAVGGRDVILVPHTPLYGPEVGMGTRWETLTETPPEVMPLVEIFSTHGNSEYYDCPRHVLWQGEGQSVVDALEMGFRLGFIGSSDYHEMLTGSLLRIQDTPRTVNNAHMQARCGLAAVRAEGLSRPALFEAMQRRSTYATSGIRAYVDFRIDGHPMGSEFQTQEPRRLGIAVAAPERIVKLEVVRNADVIADVADGNWFVETEITDCDPIPAGAFYYLRVTTERDDFAWSSPIWVDPPSRRREDRKGGGLGSDARKGSSL
ncbi:MAG: DUF3604 domain-containing protein [Phycisphaerae bacterium]|jgi:hypothetical protein|nr:DUF3604 domain-containing protein [Phycisphaerae bacterium]MDP7637116.1 DUF3604 domain-containing protein [Phycisphaerae bacterium]